MCSDRYSCFQVAHKNAYLSGLPLWLRLRDGELVCAVALCLLNNACLRWEWVHHTLNVLLSLHLFHDKLHPTLTNSPSLGRLGKDGAGSAAAAERAEPIEFSPLRILRRVLPPSVEKRAKSQTKILPDFFLWTLSGCCSLSTRWCSASGFRVMIRNMKNLVFSKPQAGSLAVCVQPWGQQQVHHSVHTQDLVTIRA